MTELTPPPPAPHALFRLDDRVVLVTGASSGIGARWASVLAAAGAHLVLAARRAAELQAVADGIPGALAVPTDLTVAADRERLVAAALDAHGRIDVLVNNAAIAVSAPALDTPVATFADVLDADLTATFALTQLVGASMVASGRGGSIVNVSSLAAERSVDRYPLSAYASAKAGLVALTRSLAAEWGRAGVRVNAIGPAFFPTAQSGYLRDPEQVAWIETRTALGRTPELDELDGTILFLTSDASSYITGQHLVVDGGWSVF